MRRAVLLLGAALIAAVVNQGVLRNERLLEHGRLVLLELAPVDPRSLMQGDYMRLRFRAAEAARGELEGRENIDGALVLEVDEHGVGVFDRHADDAPLAPDELLMSFRVRGGHLRFATDAFFFQEGQAKLFESARYGGFRVSPHGKSLLTDMYDEERVRIGAVE